MWQFYSYALRGYFTAIKAPVKSHLWQWRNPRGSWQKPAAAKKITKSKLCLILGWVTWRHIPRFSRWKKMDNMSYNFHIELTWYACDKTSLMAKFMGPTWGPSRDNRTQVGPILAPLTLLSGLHARHYTHIPWSSTFCRDVTLDFATLRMLSNTYSLYHRDFTEFTESDGYHMFLH